MAGSLVSRYGSRDSGLSFGVEKLDVLTKMSLRVFRSGPLVPKFAGSNPAEAVGFLRVNKNPQHVGGHGCLSVVTVVCCQVEVSVTN